MLLQCLHLLVSGCVTVLSLIVLSVVVAVCREGVWVRRPCADEFRLGGRYPNPQDAVLLPGGSSFNSTVTSASILDNYVRTVAV